MGDSQERLDERIWRHWFCFLGAEQCRSRILETWRVRVIGAGRSWCIASGGCRTGPIELKFGDQVGAAVAGDGERGGEADWRERPRHWRSTRNGC